LPARFIIHTVGPVWNGGQQGEPELLASCYRSCLKLARDKGIATLAFPAISCGIYGYPAVDAAEIAVRETIAFLRKHSEIERVVFVCFEADVYRAYEETLASIPD
jgi:O-acetyl-ADP-ribose deacetylase (regulator of RNase III)